MTTNTRTTTVTKRIPNTTGQHPDTIVLGTDDAATTPDLIVNDYIVVGPGGQHVIRAHDLVDARRWVRRNLLRTLRRTHTFQWSTRRVRSTRCSVVTVTSNADGTTFEVRVLSATAPVTRPGAHRVRHDVCACEPRFSGNCAACATHGLGLDRQQLLRNHDYKRYAVTPGASVRRGEGTRDAGATTYAAWRGVVHVDRLTVEGRREAETLMCGHAHETRAAADRCAATAARTERLDGFAPGIAAARRRRTLNPCAACDGACTTSDSGRYVDAEGDDEALRVHHVCAAELGLQRAPRGTRMTRIVK